jgi:hypothetical protein
LFGEIWHFIGELMVILDNFVGWRGVDEGLFWVFGVVSIFGGCFELFCVGGLDRSSGFATVKRG